MPLEGRVWIVLEENPLENIANTRTIAVGERKSTVRARRAGLDRRLLAKVRHSSA
jgi:hypothetical protein